MVGFGEGQSEESKTLLFLKKKKQKDFYYAGTGATLPPRSPNQRKNVFFVSFFGSQKESSYFHPIALGLGGRRRVRR